LGRDIIIIAAVATKPLARTTSLCGTTVNDSSLVNEPISSTSAMDATDASVDTIDASVDAIDASVDATDASVHDAINRVSRNADTINVDDITVGCTDLTT
jgi:hypothetical protein